MMLDAEQAVVSAEIDPTNVRDITALHTRAQIARKVNFAILLLREAAELVEASQKPTSSRRSRYARRPSERDE
jgi:hypothetical protein